VPLQRASRPCQTTEHWVDVCERMPIESVLAGLPQGAWKGQ
jgi:hypothetical protein